MITTELNALDFDKAPANTRVVVAMSGGVDSSVVAGLLCRQGFDVIGITLQLYDHGEITHKAGACCAGQDIHDARAIAARLNIPHYVLNYESRFYQSVMAPFAQSYLKGETPIPCVACNQTVKFTDMLQTARDLGADAVATGHYIVSRCVDRKSGRRALYRPFDLSRDQSYFLFATTQKQIDFLRFPLGAMSKSETRAIARDMGLQIAEKPDSQDICFVPSGRYADMIERLKPGAAEPGDIVHVDGRVLGRHGGIMHFTVGQRRGIGISTSEPLYVISIDAPGNRIVVGPRGALEVDYLTLRDVNWLGDNTLQEALEARTPVWVRVRSTRPPVRARLRAFDAAVGVILDEPEMGVAPGQAGVLYTAGGDQARILGGGWIETTGKWRQPPNAQAAASANDPVRIKT